MEMIDRYLQAVKFALPQAQRDDIIKELRDSILSQIEEKEATLGRPLNEDEQAELLKKLGSPIAFGQPLSQAAVPDWSHYVPDLLEGVENLAGPGVCGAGGRQYRDRRRGQDAYREPGRAVPLSQRRADDIRMDDHGFLRPGVLRRQVAHALAHERPLGSAQAAAVGEGRSPQVAIRADRAAL